MKNVLLSVIIPVYNVENYISECLDSVINQTLKNIEIICVDDGSTDGSAAILDEYVKKDNRITVIHRPNGGYGQAMNVGNSYAKGEYIAILEPDDYIDFNMYEELYNIAKKNNLDFIKSDYYRFWGDNENRKFEYTSLNGDRELYNRILDKEDVKKLFRGAIANVTGIYRRSLIEKHNIMYNETPGASYQDVGFNFQILVFMERGFVIDKAYYRYRQDNPNSSIVNRAKVFCICEEQKYIYEILKRSDKIFGQYKAYYNYMLYTTNMFAFNRIADEFKHEFIERTRQEYKALAKKKELDFSKMTNNEQIHVENIMEKNNNFVDQHIKKVDKLYGTIKDYKYVIIYGAGGKASEVLELLRGRLDEIGEVCFATTNRPVDGVIKDGYPVKCIYDLKNSREEAIVLLGVSELYLKQILLKLDELGFDNRVKIF